MCHSGFETKLQTYGGIIYNTKYPVNPVYNISNYKAAQTINQFIAR